MPSRSAKWQKNRLGGIRMHFWLFGSVLINLYAKQARLAANVLKRKITEESNTDSTHLEKKTSNNIIEGFALYKFI